MFSVSIDELMSHVRAERDRMTGVLNGSQDPTRDDLEVIVDRSDDDGAGRDRVLDLYRDYVTRSGALIERYEAGGQ